jgi:hypothetical protein
MLLYTNRRCGHRLTPRQAGLWCNDYSSSVFFAPVKATIILGDLASVV